MADDTDDVKTGTRRTPNSNELETIKVTAKNPGTIIGQGGRIIHLDPKGVPEARETTVHPDDYKRLIAEDLIEGEDDGAGDPFEDGDRPVSFGRVAPLGAAVDATRTPAEDLQRFTAGGQEFEDGVEQTTGLATLNSTGHPQDLGKVKGDIPDAAPTKRGPGRPPKAKADGETDGKADDAKS